MVGIVIVSHSQKIAAGLEEVAQQVSSSSAKIIAAGGVGSDEIGTDATRIEQAIKDADTGDGVAVLFDLGSALLSTETALEFLDEAQRKRVSLADAPLVEGTIGAAVSAAVGSPLAEVIAAAQEARGVRKL